MAVLPNSEGKDSVNELVTIANSRTELVNLDSWKLIGKAGNEYLLSGSVEPGKSLVVTLTGATMPLNNDGDTVILVDTQGVERSRIDYSGGTGESGRCGEG